MHFPSTRSAAKRILGRLTPTARYSLSMVGVCICAAAAVALLPNFEGLSADGQRALFIMLFCSGLWVTEAMPAFAVSLLAIGLEIALLGRAATDRPDWEKYVATWGSPLIWLFFGGFVLAAAAKKTQLDRKMARLVLGRLGNRPAIVLLGIMGSTAVLSMFLSNTATATLMVAILAPLMTAKSEEVRRYAKPLLLGVAMAANIGGMGTVIGTPPNAIAVGALAEVGTINFFRWMIFGIPPAVLLLALAWGYLIVCYLGRQAFMADQSMKLQIPTDEDQVPGLVQALVVVTFFLTVLMWMTSPLHGVPTTVVSFLPICLLTATRTLDAEDVKSISWDVLLLIAGGLSLGVAIRDTGLANWIVDQLPTDGVGRVAVAASLAYLATILSNLMSNTAAANVILPLALALLGRENAMLVVPIALSASAAMCLPISTPPNAIVYGTGRMSSKDLLLAGLIVGIAAPVVSIGWMLCVEAAGYAGIAD